MMTDFTISELSEKLKHKKISSVEIIHTCYEQIARYNPKINALVTVIDKKIALREAQQSDNSRNSTSTPLHGIPYILKDSYITRGIRTSAASKILESYIPQYDATVYSRLSNAGAILIGKANMDAWGHGATSENNDFGPVKNPWDPTRTAGGSTGGVAAAIASGMAVFGIGEDTGGSIRNPSAWCNVTGLKVTYGRVSRYGCIAYASSFDTVGPMAHTALDTAIILRYIAGVDPRDASSSPEQVPAYDHLAKYNTKLTIGIPRKLISQGLDGEIGKSICESERILKKLGYTIKDVDMPMLEYGLPVYYLIAPSETSSNLARYDGIRYGSGRENFTPESMRRIMIGTYALSAGYYDAYYKKAQQARTLFIQEYDKALSECDVILMPITAVHPPKLGESVSDPLQNMLIDLFTVTQNPVGVPALALPCGFSSSGLPIGLQLIGRKFAEDTLFSIGSMFQSVTNFHTKMIGK